MAFLVYFAAVGTNMLLTAPQKPVYSVKKSAQSERTLSYKISNFWKKPRQDVSYEGIFYTNLLDDRWQRTKNGQKRDWWGKKTVQRRLTHQCTGAINSNSPKRLNIIRNLACLFNMNRAIQSELEALLINHLSKVLVLCYYSYLQRFCILFSQTKWTIALHRSVSPSQ